MRINVRRTAAVIVAVLATGCGDPDAASTQSPLNAIFGEPLSEAESRAKELQREEAVATCMQALGWDYTPIDYAAQFADQPAFEDPSEPGYGEKYGYGIVRGYELYEWPYLDDEGNYTDDSPFSGGGFEDPNQEYVNSLGPEEMERYYADLNGDPSIWETSAVAEGDGSFAAPVMPSLEDQGCYGKAQLEVYGDQPWNDQDFNDRMNEAYEQLQNDPEIVDAEINWSDCIWEANPDYDFFGPDDTWQYVDGMLQEAKGLRRVEVDPNTGEIIGRPGEYPTSGWQSNADNSEAWGYEGQQKRLSEVEIREVQALEIDLWKADQACQDDSGLAEIRRRREQELADMIRDEFPQFVEGGE